MKYQRFRPNCDVLSLPVLLLILLFSGLAFGQGIVTGSISGTVQDEQGALVQGSTAQATQLATNRVFTAVSSGAGVVSLSSLPAGTYSVAIDKQGFAGYNAKTVSVEVARTHLWEQSSCRWVRPTRRSLWKGQLRS